MVIGELWSTGAGNGDNVGTQVRAAPGYAQVTTVAHDVWVVSAGSGGSLHSTNGGRTWQTLPTLSGKLVTFSDRLNGWIAQDASYLRTTDGGVTWHRLTSAPKPGITRLVATPDGSAWAAGGYVVKSTNGGRSWRRVTRRSVTAVAAVSGNQAWAVGPKGLSIHTVDGGHRWFRQTTGVTTTLREVVFVDAKHGWAGGAKGTLLRTVDGGHRWIAKHVAVDAGVRQLAFADDEHGIALFDTYRPDVPSFLITGNGGRTWTEVRLPVATEHPTAVTMFDARHALAIASDPRHHPLVAHSWTSSDGGKTWQPGTDLIR